MCRVYHYLFWCHFHLQETQSGRRGFPLKHLLLCNLTNGSREEKSSSGGSQKSWATCIVISLLQELKKEHNKTNKKK